VAIAVFNSRNSVAELRPLSANCSGKSILIEGMIYALRRSLTLRVVSEGNAEPFPSTCATWQEFVAATGDQVFCISTGASQWSWRALSIADGDVRVMPAGKATLRE